ncbi:MAG: undecaprenyl/decaprenyl-phosphate alpha-N-acetylglucosaminyl 1-phosphate transferase, partial [Planctomycetota bacterium]|nr:undecaprenyl/decaprenyl-phosphate alpha-N-acetylglucosaminyl 1-phosphate transferase [Planctomycetota bacterium]
MKYEAFLLAYGLSASSAFFFVPLLRRLGLVSHPRPDRLGERKIALAGGFSLLFGFVFTLFVFGLFSEKELFSVALLSIAVGIIGFLDDIRHLPPSAKLSLLLLTSGALILSGVFVNIYFPVLGVPLSFLWFAGVPNAFNLIDNADGIASGVGAISAFTIGVSAYIDENLPCSIAALSLAGASCGVLVHNFPPARVFLGDCGSLSLGFALSALAVIATWREASSLLMMLTIPLLFVALPLFDTLFVTVSRLSRGISPLQGLSLIHI